MARFVLCHGAFLGAWCWEPVIDPLQRAGHSVNAPDLPGSGDDRTPVADVTLEACATRVCEALAESEEPSVLVCHSMGGVVSTQSYARCPQRVRKLVYLSAFLPRDGQSLLDLAHLPEGASDQVQANLTIEGDPPVGHLSPEATRQAVYNLCSDEQWAWASARRRPQALAPFATPVALGGIVAQPRDRVYIHTLEDNAIPLALQRRMVSENPCATVYELVSDHAPFVSRTDELVAILDEIARS